MVDAIPKTPNYFAHGLIRGLGKCKLAKNYEAFNYKPY